MEKNPRAKKKILGWEDALNSLMRSQIRDPESFWPWIQNGKIRIRDKHPGSATMFHRLAKTTIFSTKRGRSDTLLEIKKTLALTYAINALLSELASWQRKVPDEGGCQAFDQIFLEEGENLFQTLI
jgi:hypothetical protein